jgi:hypothetical protein
VGTQPRETSVEGAEGVERAARFDDEEAAYAAVSMIRGAVHEESLGIHVFPRNGGALVTFPAEIVERHPEIHDVVTRAGGVAGWTKRPVPKRTSIRRQPSRPRARGG